MLLFGVILFCFGASNSQPSLELTPLVATTFVGGEVTFSCIIDDPLLEIAWPPLINKFIPSNGNVKKLTYGVPDNSLNNTEIHCAGRYSSPSSQFYFSNEGKILIQGILSKIDINVFRKDVCTMQVSWVPPFTLPGVPILGYNVNITNLDKNITDNNFINDTNIDITLGYDYYVSVAAVNDAGEGNKTTIEINSTELLNFTEGFSIEIVNVMRDQNKWKIDANIDVAMICGNVDAKFVYNFCNYDSCFNTTNITRTELSNNRVLLSTLLFLPEDQYYNAQLKVDIFKRVVLSSSGKIMSTYDVQSVEETYFPAFGAICLAIYYVKGSAATGCQMNLDCPSNYTFLFNIDGYNNQFHKFWCSPELPLVGVKCLLQIYDRVGQVNQNTSSPAITSTINIIGAIPATTEHTIPGNTGAKSAPSIAGVVAVLSISVTIMLTTMIVMITVLMLFVKVRRKKRKVNIAYSLKAVDALHAD